VRIRVSDGHRDIRIWIPSGLVFNKLTISIGIWAMKKYTPQYSWNLTAEQLNAVFSELRRIKAKHGSWELVNVQGSDGEMVRVIL
jgi:hypothetical protein